MSETSELEQVMAAAAVADALRDGDFDALCELADVLNASCEARSALLSCYSVPVARRSAGGDCRSLRQYLYCTSSGHFVAL